MKLETLIRKLQDAADKFGADAEVVVTDGEGEYGEFGIHPHTVDDADSETGTGTQIIIDLTTDE